MTRKEAINILMDAYESKVLSGGRCCGKTNFRTALLMGAESIGALEQYKWERDIALMQLEKLGISFGQKIDGVYLSKEEYEKLLEKGR